MSREGWDNFWQHSAKQQQMPCFGEQGDILGQTWIEAFQSTLGEQRPATVLDIACGNGDLIARYGAFAGDGHQSRLLACDYSPAACVSIANSDQSIHSLCCNAAELPFANDCADLILSQYGIEYAGANAFEEALRCLKPGGHFMAVCHAQEGAIISECSANDKASQRFLASGIFEQAKGVFSVAAMVLTGRALQSEFVEADRAFSVSVTQCKQLFSDMGGNVAGGYLYRVYSELGQMFAQIHSYNTEEVLLWLSNTEQEMRAYQARMASMTSSAMSQQQLETLFKNYQSNSPHTHCRWTISAVQGNAPVSTTGVEDTVGWLVIFSKQ